MIWPLECGGVSWEGGEHGGQGTRSSSIVSTPGRVLITHSALISTVWKCGINSEGAKLQQYDNLLERLHKFILDIKQGCLFAMANILSIFASAVQMAGFYRSGYTTVEGESRVMASTQFEALDARRCFPCWDEPARKSIFQVTHAFQVYKQVGENHIH